MEVPKKTKIKLIYGPDKELLVPKEFLSSITEIPVQPYLLPHYS